MPNSKDLTSEPNPSFLYIGDSGTGKTTLMGQTPGLFVYDFDKGMATLRGKSIEYETFKDAPRESKSVDPKQGIYPWGTAWPAFIQHLNRWWPMIQDGTMPYRAIGLDSLTTMGTIALNYVLKDSGHKKGDPVDPGRWYSQQQLIESVLDQLTAWPVIKILTAHVQRDTNMITNSVEMLPLITGKLAGKIGIYFDEIYFCDVKRVGAGATASREYYVTTASDAMKRSARSRHNVPDGTKQDWAVISKYVLPAP